MREKGHRRLPGGGAIRTSGGFKDSSLGLQGGGKHLQAERATGHKQHGATGISGAVRVEGLHRRKSSSPASFPHHSNELALQCL